MDLGAMIRRVGTCVLEGLGVLPGEPPLCVACGVPMRRSRYGAFYCGSWGCENEDPTGGER